MKTMYREVSLFYGLFIGLTVFLAGCSTSHFPWVYRMDVAQGNIVDAKQLDQLTTGMTKRQVRYLLGTPLIKDTFHPDRWDYFYSYETSEGIISRKQLTLTFEELKLVSIDKKALKTLKRKFY